MKFCCCPNDPERFATNLRRDNTTGNLMWDNAQGQDALIIQTPFGISPTDQLDEICEAMSKCDLQDDAYTEVMSGICVRYVSATDKAKNRGCILNGEASTYTVLGCSKDADYYRVYRPQDHSIISSKCDIPLRICVEVTKQTISKGLFRKREEETGFYLLRFPNILAGSLSDGDVAYRIGSLEIPVTKKMVEQGAAFVESKMKPVFVTKNNGFMLE